MRRNHKMSVIFDWFCASRNSRNNQLQVTKNQHIVPQLHLKKFLASGESKLKCFNADDLRIEKPQSPISICSSEFHYAMKPGEYDDYSQRIEKAFGDIEDWYGKNIDRIEQSLIAGKNLSDNDRYGVACVIANFYFRGRRHRESVRKLSLEIADRFYPNDSKAKEVAERTSHATNAALDEGHANTLTHKWWRVLVNQSEIDPFITSDEAVIEIHNKEIPETFIFRGSFLHQTQIFHLSPRIAIIALFPFTEELHGKTEFINVSNNPAGVAGNNLQYINYCHKYSYSSNETFFEKIIQFEKTKIKP